MPPVSPSRGARRDSRTSSRARPIFDATEPTIPSAFRITVRRKLLRWYDRNKRDLPWRRRGRDPYAVWVAEVMLQQTRVETVIEYYEPFLTQFPDLRALCDAGHEEVLKHWEGLGYYRRILHLHEAARILYDRGGDIPSTASELRRLPGVGDYTAAAIASIAFDKPEAAVDGNVARVLSRLLGVQDDVLSTTGKARIKEIARQLLSRTRPGDFNQAWMDLGSLICTPKTPECDQCPLASLCVAAASGRVDELPVRGTGRRNVCAVSIVVAIFLHDGKMLVHRRPTGGLWSGLWEFPNAEVHGQTSHARVIRCIAQGDGVAGYGIRGREESAASARRAGSRGSLELLGRPRKVATVHHRLTHRALTLHVYVCVAARPDTLAVAGRRRRWVTLRGFAQLSVSTAHRRVFEAAQTHVALES